MNWLPLCKLYLLLLSLLLKVSEKAKHKDLNTRLGYYSIFKNTLQSLGCYLVEHLDDGNVDMYEGNT